MKIQLDIFEGPLDLLLYLIKKNHLSVYDIPMVVIVDQYLQFLEFMKLFDINLAGEYLVMAATLINIKSKMLLPQEPPEQDEEIDPREELVKKLLEYEKFKEAAEFLRDKERDRLRYVQRPALDVPDKEVYIEASIFDLINAFKAALKDIPKDVFFEIIKDEFTVEEKIHDLLHILVAHETIPLESLFAHAKNKLEIVVTFLAILELMKMREIIAMQNELFGTIVIMRRPQKEMPPHGTEAALQADEPKEGYA